MACSECRRPGHNIRTCPRLRTPPRGRRYLPPLRRSPSPPPVPREPAGVDLFNRMFLATAGSAAAAQRVPVYRVHSHRSWSVVTTNVGANLKWGNFSDFAHDVRAIPSGHINVWQEVSSDALVADLARSVGHTQYAVVAIKEHERMGVSWADPTCRPEITTLDGPMHDLTRLSAGVLLTLPDGCTILAVHLARGGGVHSKGFTQRAWLAQLLTRVRPQIVVGDMNCTPDELEDDFSHVFGPRGLYESVIPDDPAYQTTPKLKNDRSGPIDHIWINAFNPVGNAQFRIANREPSIVRAGGKDQFIIDHYPVVFQFQR